MPRLARPLHAARRALPERRSGRRPGGHQARAVARNAQNELICRAPTSSISARARRSTPASRTSTACRPRSRSSTRPRARCCATAPRARLTTEVLATALPDETGTITGDLVLRGGGDPTLDAGALSRLAGQIAQGGLERVTGRVIGDESAFDAFRGVPSSNFRLTSEVGPLSALSYNRGRTGVSRPYYQSSPALLRRAGLRPGARAPRHQDRRRRPLRAGADRDDAVLGVAVAPDRDDRAPDEPAVGQLHRRDAEQGPRARSSAARAPPRPAARSSATPSRRFGISPTIVDGSGLSRANRTTPREVVHAAQEPGRVRGRPPTSTPRWP